MNKPQENSRDHVLALFGKEVASRRQGLGLSQEVLAELSGLHRTYIGAVERGLRNPTLTSILRIAQGLGCHPRELLGKSGSK